MNNTPAILLDESADYLPDCEELVKPFKWSELQPGRTVWVDARRWNANNHGLWIRATVELFITRVGKSRVAKVITCDGCAVYIYKLNQVRVLVS